MREFSVSELVETRLCRVKGCDGVAEYAELCRVHARVAVVARRAELNALKSQRALMVGGNGEAGIGSPVVLPVVKGDGDMQEGLQHGYVRRRHAKISGEELLVLHGRHVAGESVAAIGRDVCGRFGFASAMRRR